MTNRVILATKIIAISLGVAIAGIFVWLMATDRPDEDAPAGREATAK